MSPFFRKQVSKQAENPIFKQLKSTWDSLLPGNALPQKTPMRLEASRFLDLFGFLGMFISCSEQSFLPCLCPLEHSSTVIWMENPKL